MLNDMEFAFGAQALHISPKNRKVIGAPLNIWVSDDGKYLLRRTKQFIIWLMRTDKVSEIQKFLKAAKELGKILSRGKKNVKRSYRIYGL